jgi:hypothetical protein
MAWGKLTHMQSGPGPQLMSSRSSNPIGEVPQCALLDQGINIPKSCAI